MKQLLILHGPNLNLLGVREPAIYGTQSFDTYLAALRQQWASKAQIDFYQSNVEGFLIDKLQVVGFTYDGIIFNAGAYAHTSIALADAIRSISTPVVEVHISNTARREAFRQTSYIAAACQGSIVGLGLQGYALAIDYFFRFSQTQGLE